MSERSVVSSRGLEGSIEAAEGYVCLTIVDAVVRALPEPEVLRAVAPACDT